MTTEQEQKKLEEALDTKYDVDNYEFGQSQGLNNQDLLESQREALEMLKESIVSSPEISPTQALAAGALAIAPAIGGYFAGRSAGNAYISPWLKPETILGMDLPGGAAGAAEGLELGRKEGDEYLNELKAYQLNEAKQKFNVGSKMLEQTGLAQRSQASLDAANSRQGLAIEAANARQQRGIEGQFALARFKDFLKNNNTDGLPDNPTLQSAKQKIIAGQGDSLTSEETAELARSTKKLPELTGLVNAISRKENVDIRGEVFERGSQQLGIPGYEAPPNAKMLPSAATATALQQKSGGLDAMKVLLQTYVNNPGDPIIGQASAINAALGGMLMNAGRLLTKSGANFTETEQMLIKRALPSIMANDLPGAIKAMALGRDQKTFAQDIQNIMQKAFDYEVLGSAGYKRTGAPAGWYGTNDQDLIEHGWLQSQGNVPAPNPSATPSASATPRLSAKDFLKQLRGQQ